MLKKYKPLVISIALSLGVGALSAFITMGDIKEQYMAFSKPPLSPPGYVFGIVWAVLYVLMGVSAYIVYKSDSSERLPALFVYGVQLIVNFLWPILFFTLEMRLAAFFLILILIALIVLMVNKFYKVEPYAAYLQIPYLFWCIFAAYLNIGIYILNR
ncbi:tryptophan-rich sensory protein [Lachnospiraceae bacterium NSJ-143]|nr:tryptophan-rich sensory protein [Lachnospiraceae bacterium NSJ-143]